MKVEYRKKFLKELSKISRNSRIKIEHFVFNEMSSVDSKFENSKIEKMKGYNNYFKVRFAIIELVFK